MGLSAIAVVLKDAKSSVAADATACVDDRPWEAPLYVCLPEPPKMALKYAIPDREVTCHKESHAKKGKFLQHCK